MRHGFRLETADLGPLGASRSVFDALVRTDADYFAAGAKTTDLGGANLIALPGFTRLAGGCVVLSSGQSQADPVGLIARAETAVDDAGGQLYRWYITAPGDPLIAALQGRGYQARFESVLASPSVPTAERRVRLREVTTQADWELKAEVDRSAEGRPDGHECSPARWSEFEHVKWSSGAVQFFVAEAEGVACGTVGLMKGDGLFRMKNLFVHPTWRRQGVATEITRAIRQLVFGSAPLCGVFAVMGGPGERLYRDADYEPVGYVMELTKQRGARS
jgi:GNAT superfamily N-acetyltransferase